MSHEFLQSLAGHIISNSNCSDADLVGEETENISGQGLDWYKKESNNFVLTAIYLKKALHNINDRVAVP